MVRSFARSEQAWSPPLASLHENRVSSSEVLPASDRGGAPNLRPEAQTQLCVVLPKGHIIGVPSSQAAWRPCVDCDPDGGTA
jgi:hypothetical protein